MRLMAWKGKAGLVKWLVGLSKAPEWPELEKMLMEEHPMQSMLPAGSTEVDNLRHMGRIEGYQLALTNLHSAMERAKDEGDMPEATFEPPKDL